MLRKWVITVENKYKVDVTKLTGVPETVIDIMFTSGSPLGNPFYKEKDRDRVCEQFINWFNQEVVKEGSAVRMEIIRILEILKRVGRLYLVCCCKPARCHGDTIKKSLDDAMVKHTNSEIRRYINGQG